MKWTKTNDMLIKDFEFKDFKSAMVFVNKVAKLAEKLNHHPNILVHSYKHVRITLTTHSVSKVTDKDIKLSKLIDKIVL